MGSIINLDGIAWAAQAKKGRQEFSVTFHAGGIDFAMYGDLQIIIQMLYQVMEAYPQAAKAIITTVLIFADKKGIRLEDLKKHSFITDQKIVTD